jgi:exopolysaccharide biosynthesis polyprenyl glycosylphosphotransferase
MFRAHAKLITALQFFTDLFLSAAAFALAYFTRTHLAKVVPPGLESLLNPILNPLSSYIWILLLALGWWAVSAYSLGLYRLSMRRSYAERIRTVLESSLVLGLFLGFLSFALRLNVSRPLIFLFVFYQAVILTLARLLLALHAKGSAHPSEAQRNIVIVGDGSKAREMGALISSYSDWGLGILGYVAVNDAGARRKSRQDDVLGTISDIPRIIADNVVDEIIFVGSEPGDLGSFEDVLLACREQGIRTRLAADFFPAKVSTVSMEFLENVPLITFSTTPDHPLSLFVKRAMDVVFSILLLMASLPLMILVALLVKLTSKGPIIYSQVRSGLYGRKFVLYKFRSMQEGAQDVLWEIKHLNEMDGPVFKMRLDPRVTVLGRFLRKYSIDEWPQFWNVLKGDMSLVGPRAPLPEEVLEYTRWQRRRLSVKPGITCLWQVSGRNEIDFHEWMKLDLHYIDNWSLLLDLKILLRTFPVVLFGKGAR